MIIHETVKLPFPANKIVTDFASNILNINEGFIEGIYLTGSLAMDDYKPGKSDIDFIVLCKNLPGNETIQQLQRIHKTISRRYKQSGLSGVYLASDSIYADNPLQVKTLNYHKGKMLNRNLEMAPVSLWELKNNSVTIYGQNADTLPVDVSVEALTEFLYQNVNSYWAGWLHKYSALYRLKILLYIFPWLTEWSVLGIARQLYTLQTGKITSKTQAGYYCLSQLPANYHPTISLALSIRNKNRLYTLKPSFQRPLKTIACVKYMINTFNEIYNTRLMPKYRFL